MAFRKRSLVVLGTALALAMPARAGADWPVYGHDLANSRSAGAAGPAKSAVAKLQRAWTFKSSNGDFTGTPVVADGTLVAGSNLGSIYALDAVTGKLRWSRDVGQQINGSAAIDPDAPHGPTVFVPIAQIGRPRLLALSLRTGRVRWEAVLSRQDGADVFGSPVYRHGTVYIGTSGPNNDESHARGTVVALNEATGRIRWRTYTVPRGHDGGAVWSTPAIDPATGRLYVGTGNAYHEPAAGTTDSMLVLDAASGRILGHLQTTSDDVWELDSPTSGPDHDFGASPNLIRAGGGRPLVGEGSKSGIYWALDRATMKPVWKRSIGPGSTVGGILAATAYDGTRIYGNDTIDSQVWALGRNGSKRWDSADGGTLDFSPVSVANGVLYSPGPSSFLTARDAASGSILTKLPLDGPAFGGVSAVGRAVYVATGTGPPLAPTPSTDTSKTDGSGSIIAFGDTSRSGASARRHRPPIRLSVRPRHVKPRRRVAFHFRARGRSGPLAGVRIRLAGHRARTGGKGRATIRARLPHRGTYVARASRRGMASGTARIVAGRPHRGGRGHRHSPLTFSGRCDFSGSVRFQPALTNTPQSVIQHVRAPGTCSGNLVDGRGRGHELAGAPVTFQETSKATGASCLFGTATGSAALTFRYGALHAGFSETRVGPFPVAELSGAKGGSAHGTSTPTPGQDPTAALQQCGGSGLKRFDIDVHAATTPSISG